MKYQFDLVALDVRSEVEIASLSDTVISIGRDITNNILIGSESVSRRHASVILASDTWVFVDCESTNGSWINDVKVLPGRFYTLRNADVLQLGDTRFRFTYPDEARRPEPRLSLLLFAGDRFEREFEFLDPHYKFVIGTKSGDIVISDSREVDNLDESSVFSLLSTGFALDSNISSMRVFINGNDLAQTSKINDRDSIEIGIYSILVVDDLRKKLNTELTDDNKSVLKSVGMDRLLTHIGSQEKGEDLKTWDDDSQSGVSSSKNCSFQRENSFTGTVAIKGSNPSFGQPLEDNSHDSLSALHSEKDQASADIDYLQVALGVIFVILTVAVAMLMF